MNQRDQIAMSAGEVSSFLEASWSACCATIGENGMPHLVAMWFTTTDGMVSMVTKAKSQKARNLQRDPRLAVMVEVGRDYRQLRGVSLEGTAHLSSDPDLVWRIGAGIHERRHGPLTPADRASLANDLRNRIAVVVAPERVRSWDHRKLPT